MVSFYDGEFIERNEISNIYSYYSKFDPDQTFISFCRMYYLSDALTFIIDMKHNFHFINVITFVSVFCIFSQSNEYSNPLKVAFATGHYHV